MSTSMKKYSGLFKDVEVRILFYRDQRVTKRCRLSLLTNSALVYEPQCVGIGWVARSQPWSTAVHITWHGAQINLGLINRYLTYDRDGSIRPKVVSENFELFPPVLPSFKVSGQCVQLKDEVSYSNILLKRYIKMEIVSLSSLTSDSLVLTNLKKNCWSFHKA